MALKAYLQDGRVLCSSCSSPLEPNASSCSECGEQIEGDFKAIVCPSCDIILSSDTTKCYNCGLKFKAVSKKPETPEDQAFLWRLLKWGQEASSQDEPKVIKPTIEKEVIERFTKEEARVEKEESIQSLVEAFKIIINAWKKRWSSEQLMSRTELRTLVQEEKEALDHLEILVNKVETLFSELMEKYRTEAQEKEATVAAKPGESAQEIVELKKTLEGQRDDLKVLKTQLEEKDAKINEFQKKYAELEETNIEMKKLNDEVKEVLKVLDELLGKLSEEEIERFAKSNDFKRYEAILDKFAI